MQDKEITPEIQKEFANYQQSLRLKKLGFDEPCFTYFDCERESKFNPNKRMFLSCEILRPTLSQAFRFFRNKDGLHPHIFSKEDGTFVWCIRWYVDGLQKDIPYELSNTYEEAESACLDKLIEIVETIKSKKNE